MYKDKDLQHHYDEEYFSGRFRPELWNRRAEFIIEKFHPSTTLDIGCSYGELVKFLNDFGVDAYGIDGSEYVLSQVDNSIKNKVFKVNFNEDKFPFADDFFDFITGYYVVEHIHNFKFFADELKRTLKKNGSAWFLTPDTGEEGRNQYDVFTNRYDEWKKIKPLRQWLRERQTGWKKILTLRNKQVFKIIRLGGGKSSFLYVCANSRQ